MNEIILLTDYKNRFGSKWDAIPYRSGFDKKKLKEYFGQNGFETEFYCFSDLPSFSKLENSIVLYTSSEDIGYSYKSYIEDIILNLERRGIKVIPRYDFLRANNNKVYMELLRKRYGKLWNDHLNSFVFGTYEEMERNIDKVNFPVVIKKAEGAMSRGVFLAKSKEELIKKVKNITRVKYLIEELKDRLRPFKHKGYLKDSVHRTKYILQQYIPNLKSDYKILIFGEYYYIFERPVRKNDFRASGSGNKNYIYGSNVSYPEGIFDFAKTIFIQANVPNLSIDIAYNDLKFYLLEFQALYFGTVGHVKADGYYVYKERKWNFVKNKLDIEKVYSDSIHTFLQNKYI